MKKILSSLSILALSVSLAAAGDDYSKAPVDAKAPLPPMGCACFDPGFEFGFFGGAFIPDEGDTAGGGGASLAYFFTENIGIETSYGVYATDPSEEHLITANLVYRVPIKDACIAPYLLVGGGLLTNSNTNAVFDIGGGIDIRLEALGCVGLFVDATYNWINKEDDFTLIRGGVRIPF